MGFIIKVNNRFLRFSEEEDLGSDAVIVEEKSRATVFKDDFMKDAEILCLALNEKGFKYNLVSGPFEVKDAEIIAV